MQGILNLGVLHDLCELASLRLASLRLCATCTQNKRVEFAMCNNEAFPETFVEHVLRVWQAA